MPLIRTKYRGRCAICGEPIEPGGNAYWGEGKLICTSPDCSAVINVAKKADEDGPMASALQFRGTSIEVVRQLRTVAQHLASSLKAAAKEAEALALGLQQIEDQQQTGQKR